MSGHRVEGGVGGRGGEGGVSGHGGEGGVSGRRGVNGPDGQGGLSGRRGAASGLGFALAAALFFGGAGPVAKALIGAGLSPLETVWLRLAGAALVLVPAVLLGRRAAVAALLRGRGLLVLGYGVFAIAAVQALYFVAVSRLPVGVALLIEYTAPVLVIAWVRLVRRVRLPGLAYGGAAGAVIGLACVVQVWSGLRLDAVGLVAAVGAAGCQASFFLLSDRLTLDGDPLVLTACGVAVATAVLAVAARPWALPWHVLGGVVPFAGHRVAGPLLLVWLALVATVLAYVTAILAIGRLSAPVAGVVASTEVVVAAVLAWMLLGERLAAVQILGGAVVLAGALTAQRGVAGRRDPDIAGLDTVGPGVAGPDTVGPGVAGPDAAFADLRGPDSPCPDAAAQPLPVVSAHPQVAGQPPAGSGRSTGTAA